MSLLNCEQATVRVPDPQLSLGTKTCS